MQLCALGTRQSQGTGSSSSIRGNSLSKPSKRSSTLAKHSWTSELLGVCAVDPFAKTFVEHSVT
eukprot:7308273-Pyramimonas_sp.AAC.1